MRERQTELLPYNKGGLDHVEVGLDQRQPQRALRTEEDDTNLDLTLCLLLSACFLDLEDEIRGSSDSSVY